MPTFQRAIPEVAEMAREIINEYETHASLRDKSVKIDFVFAFPDFDDLTGNPLNDALTKGGRKCLGLARKLSLKDRAMGRADAEISLDGHWWESADDKERRALLDHEITHLVATEKRDDLGRPVIKLRKHDLEIGWFHCVAARHGQYSQERIQANMMMADAGQLYWPEIVGVLQSSKTRAASSRTAKLEMAEA